MADLTVSFAHRQKLSWCFIAAAVLLGGFYVAIPPIAKDLVIEFISRHEEELFFHWQFPGLLMALALLAAGLLLTITHWLDVLIRLLLLGFIGSLLFVYLISTVFDGMCVWTTDIILFEQRADSGTVIALRSMGCGARVSGPPVYNTFKMTSLTSHFVQITKIDTATLNHSQWQRVHRQLRRRF